MMPVLIEETLKRRQKKSLCSKPSKSGPHEVSTRAPPCGTDNEEVLLSPLRAFVCCKDQNDPAGPGRRFNLASSSRRFQRHNFGIGTCLIRAIQAWVRAAADDDQRFRLIATNHSN
jgi:hypothetical protein